MQRTIGPPWPLPGPAEHLHGPEEPSQRPTRAYTIDLSALFPGNLILHGPTTSRSVALTFDDGPDPRFTPLFLDILSRLGVKATFFVVGQRVDAYPALFRRIVQEGHAYGNHTYRHANLTRLSPAALRPEVQRCEDAIARVAGHRTRLFRPPYGALTPEICRELIAMQYKLIYWNVDSLDWMGLNAAQVAANILAHAGPGSIVLQHAGGGRGENLIPSARALPYIVTTLRRAGLTFETVPALLNMTDWRG